MTASTGQRQNGFILIVVLGAILVLSGLLFGFNQMVRTRLNTADSFYRMELVSGGARAGLEIAIAAIRDVNDLDSDPRYSRLLTGDNTFTVDDVNCSVAIADESGLLNVNSLKNAKGELDRRAIDQFLRLIDLVNAQQDSSEKIGYGIVPCLIDWIDSDDEVTHLTFVQQENTGAENSHYQAQPQPYSCRNRPLDTVDDLLGVQGITPQVLSRLRPYLTCFGDGKININTAPKLVIESLSEQMNGAMAQMILNQRRLKPFENVAQLKTLSGMTDNVYRAIKDRICVSPKDRFYRIASRASLADRKCAVEALLRRNTQAGTVDMILYREM